jgi:putative endonuclease
LSLYRNKIGRWGEQIARDYLVHSGYTMIGSNIRTPYGEIDLLLEKAGALHFVEVKTRTSTAAGNPETGITRNKFKHIMDSAQSYLQENRSAEQLWQIDVVAVLGKPGAESPQIVHFENVTQTE